TIKVDEFTAAGVFEKTFSSGRGANPGLAVDSNGTVYVVNGGQSVSKFDPATGEETNEFAGAVSGRLHELLPASAARRWPAADRKASVQGARRSRGPDF